MEYEVSITATTRKIFIIEADKADEARKIAIAESQINSDNNMTHSSEDVYINVYPVGEGEIKCLE